MPFTHERDETSPFGLLAAKEVSQVLGWDIERLRDLAKTRPDDPRVSFVERHFNKPLQRIKSGEWELFRKWHAATSEDENLIPMFRNFERQIEESVELYFMELASASDTYAGEFFNDDTHDSFFLASREVIAQGPRARLEFLRDNVPMLYEQFLSEAGLKFLLPRRVRS